MTNSSETRGPDGESTAGVGRTEGSGRLLRGNDGNDEGGIEEPVRGEKKRGRKRERMGRGGKRPALGGSWLSAYHTSHEV